MKKEKIKISRKHLASESSKLMIVKNGNQNEFQASVNESEDFLKQHTKSINHIFKDMANLSPNSRIIVFKQLMMSLTQASNIPINAALAEFENIKFRILTNSLRNEEKSLKENISRNYFG